MDNCGGTDKNEFAGKTKEFLAAYFPKGQMKTYLEIGKSEGLKDKTLERYISYMCTRWLKTESLNCATGYAKEWAERFKYGNEYKMSDSEGTKILEKIDKGEK